VNSPDLIDVYELEIHPEDENQYFFHGKWEALEVREAKITVKLWGPFKWTIQTRNTLVHSWPSHSESPWNVCGSVFRVWRSPAG